ncbi:MAG: CidA/LrgA family protein [Victivallaceae bacterium]|nr:CidA/LrgA family protein [Victivallaceae bacterium]
MKTVRQFLIIIGISFAGEILNRVIPLPVPASVYGVLLMFSALYFRVIRVRDVRETGYFLIEIMPILFIPAAVGLLEAWAVLRPVWLPFCIITVISTFVVMGISGRITQELIIRRRPALLRKKDGCRS